MINDPNYKMQKRIYEKYSKKGEGYESFSEIFNLTNSNHLRMIKKLGMKKGDKVLDVGCASGNLMRILSKKYGIRGYGIDITPTSIIRAKKLLKNCDFCVSRAEKLKFKDNYFDFVVSFGCLEHVSDFNKSISEIKRVLKRGGKALIWMPNKDNRYSLHWLDGKINPKKQREDMERAGHDYNRIPSSDTILGTVIKNRMRICEYKFYDSFLQPFYDYKIMPFNSRLLRWLAKCVYGKDKIKDEVHLKHVKEVSEKRAKIYKIYKMILPFVRFVCIPDKIFSKLRVGASIYVIMEKE
ncbi:hypothetical protein COV19_05460 [Candidatus Woesearchaeota archaeon CG10_big_fil_rev_8_21_14_0_10_44_13]|nr:MAG: hypothetical protein COV19_05460 [Candidatus Woesearchaeota archaeon CG10_big_fil_rev_8_21_14_0_10_44_13]